MTATLLGMLVGLVVVIAVTVLTGYFVAQEFAYVTVDRSRLRTRAEEGDETARRALEITGRTSFMLSGAQLGITVTGLVVGFVAEPMIGQGVAALLGGTGLPRGVLAVAGGAVALALATVVQMVFGELVPKNLAIARPEPLARRLALSTKIYLGAFGWLIRLFDAAANALLRALGIEPVHDVDETATPSDLEAIIDESRDSGHLPADLSLLLDRVLDFTERTARTAMVPRPEMDTLPAAMPLTEVLELMASGHSQYPVMGQDAEEVVGVIHLRDLLGMTPEERRRGTAGEAARPALLVPDTVALPQLLEQMRTERQQMACVLDEFGGLGGLVTIEDVAEELVGEIVDEHDDPELWPQETEDGWSVPGALSVEETERLIDSDLPRGRYSTIGGLLVDRLNRLARPDDVVTVELSSAPGQLTRAVPGDDRPVEVDERDEDDPIPPDQLEITVISVRRRVPERLRLRRVQGSVTHPGPEDGRPDAASHTGTTS